MIRKHLLTGALVLGAIGAIAAPQFASGADTAMQLPGSGGKGLSVGATCPDPSAAAIEFAVLRRDSPYRGLVRITGVVRNAGGAPYVSRPTQQVAYLGIKGSASPIAQRKFQNLAPGEEVVVNFFRNWNSTSPAEGEFPPTYVLWIGYDPDIRLDRNKQNDDCFGANNSIERSGAGINDLLS